LSVAGADVTLIDVPDALALSPRAINWSRSADGPPL
jgi:hypothetical protein